MELSAECIAMLELFDKPAFFAEKNTIIRANNLAEEIGISANMPLSDIIKELNGNENAVLTKQFNNVYYTITPSSIGIFTLYVMNKTVDQNVISSLMRAAQHLRSPISGIGSSIINVKDLLPTDVAQSNKHIQNATKQLFSINRTVRNMSDINVLLENNPSKKESVSICAFFQELADKMAAFLASSGVNITYTIPDMILYCMIDKKIMERALYNMVSNSLNAGSHNIQISLCRFENTLQLTVTDDGHGIPEAKKAALLNRFKNAPSLSNTEKGLGLGMLIIHAAAIKHNGTVMITDVEPKGCKVSLTFDIVKGPLTVKQIPNIMTADPTGGLETVLIEFSDFLKPDEFI